MNKIRLQFLILLASIIGLFVGAVAVDLRFFSQMTGFYRLETQVTKVVLDWTRLVDQTSGLLLSSDAIGPAYAEWQGERASYISTWPRTAAELGKSATSDKTLADQVVRVRNMIDLGLEKMSLIDEYMGNLILDLKARQPLVVERATMASLSSGPDYSDKLTAIDVFYLNTVRNSVHLIDNMMEPVLGTAHASFQGKISDRVSALDGQIAKVRLLFFLLILGVLIAFLLRVLQLNLDLMALVKRRTSELEMVLNEQEKTIATRTGELTAANAALTTEIEARREVEEKLRESEDRYRRITEGISDYQYSIAVGEGGTAETTFGLGCLSVTGYSPDELEADPDLWYRMIPQEDLEAVQDRSGLVLEGKETPPIEYRIIRKDGSLRWICDTALLRKDSCGKYALYDGVVTDITERKENERRIRKSLHEKEVLLQEVHHRVKNNLNVISSLLNLQASFIQTPEEAIKAFQYSSDRIAAMASVHQELYESNDYCQIDIKSYIMQLAERLAESYCLDPSIHVMTDIDDIELDIFFAVPIGLILSELITNALKHAFPKGGPGEILITLRQDSPGICEFSVTDTGKGISGCDEAPKKGSLGLTLVRSLVEQIGGCLSVTSAAGACISVYFPMKTRE